MSQICLILDAPCNKYQIIYSFIVLHVSKVPTLSFLFSKYQSLRITIIQRVNVPNRATIVCHSFPSDCLMKFRRIFKIFNGGVHSLFVFCQYSCIIYHSNRTIWLRMHALGNIVIEVSVTPRPETPPRLISPLDHWYRSIIFRIFHINKVFKI